MKMSVARLGAAVAIAVIGISLGVWLAVYSEADDAPGGVLIGILLMVISVALAISIVRRGARNSPKRGD
jgi:hypothetical protein